MMNMLQQLLAQQGIPTNSINLNPTTPEELMAHQEPLAASMKSLLKILEYEKGILPNNVFLPILESFQTNLNNAIDKLKIPNIPTTEDSIVSINGEPVNQASGG